MPARGRTGFDSTDIPPDPAAEDVVYICPRCTEFASQHHGGVLAEDVFCSDLGHLVRTQFGRSPALDADGAHLLGVPLSTRHSFGMLPCSASVPTRNEPGKRGMSHVSCVSHIFQMIGNCF